MSRLPRSFFEQKTITVAKSLLGKILVRRMGRKMIKGIIVETEAYCGPHDLASHASRGRTPRTDVMFGKAGTAYVYMIYGMYHCLNIVTEDDGYPAAVLIRAIEPSFAKATEGKANGPGKLCRYFHIDRNVNNEDVTTSNRLWIEDGEKIASSKIMRRSRIGVDYAGTYKDKLWRFYIKNNAFVSKK
ncbi:MAG TPA: DNA-3-methyladenine glycosylase [Patescibacteria group bacterium]|nr:DNA-3-methyladenine glycosylase [Patescibacteria group bacterium]